MLIPATKTSRVEEDVRCSGRSPDLEPSWDRSELDLDSGRLRPAAGDDLHRRTARGDSGLRREAWRRAGSDWTGSTPVGACVERRVGAWMEERLQHPRRRLDFKLASPSCHLGFSKCSFSSVRLTCRCPHAHFLFTLDFSETVCYCLHILVFMYISLGYR